MLRFVRSFYVEIFIMLIFITIILLFSSSFYLDSSINISRLFAYTKNTQLHNLSTIFLSIFLEGLPFILIGVFLSSFLHEFVNENWIWKRVPRNPILSIPMAIVMGFLLPICECGIVPITKRLIEKKLPVYTAFTFLLAAPIVNPITIVSTYIAFGNDWGSAFIRVTIGAGIAVVMGLLFFLFFRNVDVLKLPIEAKKENGHTYSDNCGLHSHRQPSWKEKIDHALHHAIFEFLNMGKFFVLGAFLAACFQTIIGYSVIQSIASHEWISILLMMAIAFGLSICSSSDAFIAASFRNVVGPAPLFGFLIYGPMMDLKNLLMMMGSFRPRIIWFFWSGTTLLTLISVIWLL